MNEIAKMLKERYDRDDEIFRGFDNLEAAAAKIFIDHRIQESQCKDFWKLFDELKNKIG